VVQEALPGPQDAWLPGPGGSYMCELVVPLVRRAPEPAVAASVPAAYAGEKDRRRHPGSDWLYLTLSGPAAAQDGIIAGPLRQVAETLVARGHARSWFFLRYTDPDPQLRFRLHGRPEDLLEHALSAILRTATDLIASGSLHRVGLEVYEREVERYGGPHALDVVESLFAVDSRAVAGLLPLVGDAGERMAVAALAVDGLLRALGLGDAARLAWYSEHAPPARESAVAHRESGGRIAELLAGMRPGDAAVREVLAVRDVAARRLGRELVRLHRAGLCDEPVTVLARSLVHMLCNRIGVDQPTERILIGLLRRHAYSRQRVTGEA
jgi:thiopeptide-type bacteriocin biosynthesis protein